MLFSLVLALWMTCGVAGIFKDPLEPLTFVDEPTDTVARKNEAVTLQCRVEGTPSPSNFTWVKDGRVIAVDHRVRIKSNGALLINPVIHTRKNKPDVGEYQCFASGSRGIVASRKVHLQVAGISKKFLYEPQRTTVRAGSIARFSCKVRHAAPPAVITWEKDNSPLISSDRLVTLDQGVLQIKNVKKADEGNYRCVASNFAKTRYSQAASLTVQTGSDVDTVRLKFVGVPHNTSVLKGRTAVLECAASGHPTPFIRWKKVGANSRELYLSKSEYGISNLNFSSVSERDGGQYQCEAISNGQTISRTAWLFVKVPPQFTKKPVHIKWTTGKPIVFHCAATGLPLPTMTWLKNGKQLISSKEASVAYYKGGADLTLSGKTKQNGGMYQCFAQNEAGSIQASSIAVIHTSDDQPGPPTNVVAVAHSSSSILVSWSPPDGHHKIIAYSLHYKKLGDDSSKEKQKVLSNNTHSHIVKKLQPFANYSFYLRAFSKKIGPVSKVVTQRTGQGKPTRPPLNVVVESDTPDSLDVRWQPPQIDYRNGIITQYVINYKQTGQGQSPISIKVPGHLLYKTINGLVKGANYSVSVCAVTTAGRGPFSALVIAIVRTQPTSVISAPDVWIADKNSSMLLVKWNPPKFAEESVEGYQLFYVQVQNKKTEQGPFIVGKQQRAYALSGLDSTSEFFIKVMAWDGKKLGRPGLVIGITDKDPLGKDPGKIFEKPPPSRPIDLVCSVKSRSSILLTWKSQPSADRIAYYSVKYQLSDKDDSKAMEQKVYLEEVLLSELVPNRNYTIAVRSHYEIESKLYHSSVSTTRKRCSIQRGNGPSAPRNVRYKYASLTAIYIRWDTPIRTNGELSSYEIRFTYNKSFPESKWLVTRGSLPFPATYLKSFSATLERIQVTKTFYIKIRVANQKNAYGPFCDTVEIKPRNLTSRVPPNVTYTVLSPKRIKLSWTCPRVLNALLTSFTILVTNNTDLPEDHWGRQSVAFTSSERLPSVVTTTLDVNQYKVYYVKVRAEYTDNIPGKWSKIVEVKTDRPVWTGSMAPTKPLSFSEIEGNPKFNVKLGIIIGCAISAFCIVVLVLFIIWRNPCRQAPVNHGKGNITLSGLPSHLQHISVSGKQDHSGSTSETSTSSGLCQCRCTCGAGTKWPLAPTIVRANARLPGSSDSNTPIASHVFPSATPDGDSEGSTSRQDIRTNGDGYNPVCSSTNTFVVAHREDDLLQGLSRSYRQSTSVDV